MNVCVAHLNKWRKILAHGIKRLATPELESLWERKKKHEQG